MSIYNILVLERNATKYLLKRARKSLKTLHTLIVMTNDNLIAYILRETNIT